MFYVVGSRLADSLLITDHDGIFAVGNNVLPLHDFDMTGKQAFVLKFNAFNFPIVAHNEIWILPTCFPSSTSKTASPIIS